MRSRSTSGNAAQIAASWLSRPSSSARGASTGSSSSWSSGMSASCSGWRDAAALGAAGLLVGGDERAVAHQHLNLAQAALGALDILERLGEDTLFNRRKVPLDV